MDQISFLFYYWAQSWQTISEALDMKVEQDVLGEEKTENI